MTNNSVRDLYLAQDTVLDKVFTNLEAMHIPDCLLAGGTALARYFLHHRISYDLDFFVGNSFNPEVLALRLGKIGVDLQDVQIEDGKVFVSQLHGYAVVNGVNVKISFIEDVYHDMWPRMSFGRVLTEEIGGLYHRKLRAISGNGYGQNTKGARQTARDMFDAFVLSTQIQPMYDFIRESNQNGANFPQEALSSNILHMPWLDLMDEFDNLAILSPYQDLSLMGHIKPALVEQGIELQKLSYVAHDVPRG